MISIKYLLILLDTIKENIVDNGKYKSQKKVEIKQLKF